MGKQNQEDHVTELDLEDLLDEYSVTEPNIPLPTPPPPPRAEFEGWTEGEEDLT